MGEIDMIYGKCPRCGEDERISSYMGSDGKITYWGVKCRSCGHIVKSMRSQEDAVSIWRTGGSERDLAPCPFCGGEVKLQDKFDRSAETTFVLCTKCHMWFEKFDWRGYSEKHIIEEWNRRVSE